MDPYGEPSRGRSRGLPRTRGDGPAAIISSPRAIRASPHTRGWTGVAEPGRVGRGGFPAHAGMDPGLRRGRSAWYRLPRTRGDGPRKPPGCVGRTWASPHTRGWTPRQPAGAKPGTGFPAHAGMDPAPAPAPRRPGRLPRTRGDGPRAERAGRALALASPHTRGWTRAGERHDVAADGFPAHAGMDPCSGTACSRWRRLPRTRGDGPLATCHTGRSVRASPHTRGWTLRPGADDARRGGFPAHAGMDPSPRAISRGRAWLPRTRGDGPDRGPAALRLRMASPHTRGWTRWQGRRLPRGRGFPAHAGMDPGAATAPTGVSGLPRTRGDGPHVCCRVIRRTSASPHTRGWTPRAGPLRAQAPGFPAHAGMDPRRRRRPGRPRRLPRTRGDGPGFRVACRQVRGASPHTRGWTRRRRRVAGRGEGFPAHAGMDRGIPAQSASRAGLPRTRGDGPGRSGSGCGAASASPHTRGWTLAPGRRPAASAGFPAHAGMDPRQPRARPSRAGLPRTRGDGPPGLGSIKSLD